MRAAPRHFGLPLDKENRARVARLVEERGEIAVLTEFDVSRHTLARILGGLCLQRGTHALVARALAGIDDATTSLGNTAATAGIAKLECAE